MEAQKIAQIPLYDWRKVLANEKWARLAITAISRNRNFLSKLYPNFFWFTANIDWGAISYFFMINKGRQDSKLRPSAPKAKTPYKLVALSNGRWRRIVLMPSQLLGLWSPLPFFFSLKIKYVVSIVGGKAKNCAYVR